LGGEFSQLGGFWGENNGKIMKTRGNSQIIKKIAKLLKS
jgi:hypothetical protein